MAKPGWVPQVLDTPFKIGQNNDDNNGEDNNDDDNNNDADNNGDNDEE